jgi:hypothetical protein
MADDAHRATRSPPLVDDLGQFLGARRIERLEAVEDAARVVRRPIIT